MKNILHITSEISRKNFSISSLLVYISKQNKVYKLFNSQIFCAKSERKSENKSIVVKNIGWLDFYKLKNILLKNFSRFDIFHIHGLWAPIQLYSIFICILNSKPLVIHPHGMLLLEAISDHGILKKFFKKNILYILKILSYTNNNLLFIAITNQEFRVIKKSFPNTKIKLINNPIPFQKINTRRNGGGHFDKSFVFFGRIHPHKNILTLIKSFIESNLGKKNWLLKIYGIKDDAEYLKKIKYLIANYPYIKIFVPVFGEKKQKIMQKSWVNVLLSKSEVLSLSLLESGLLGLPTIVNKNIETLTKDKFTIKVLPENKKIADKFIDISNWSQTYRASLNKRIINFFTEYQKKEKIYFFKNLALGYKKNFNNYPAIKNNKKPLTENFYATSFVHGINVFFPAFVLLFSYFLFKTSITADIGVVNSIFLTFTAIFSGNARLISVKKDDEILLHRTLVFRMICSILILIPFSIFLFKTLYFDDNSLIFLMATIIMFLWCFEMVLSIYEINQNILKQLFYLFIHFFFLGAFFLSFAFQKNLYTHLILAVFSIVLLISCLTNVKVRYFFDMCINPLFKYQLNLLSYFSSMSLTLSSLAWRAYAYFLFSKEISATFFIAFSLASFPGTLFNNVFGPSFFVNKISLNHPLKIFLKILFIALLAYNMASYDYLETSEFYQLSTNVLFLNIAKVSFIGTFIMTYAMYCRQKSFFNKKFNFKNLFIRDVFFGILLMFIMPSLNILSGPFAATFSYLLGSIVALLFYYKSSFIFNRLNL